MSSKRHVRIAAALAILLAVVPAAAETVVVFHGRCCVLALARKPR